MSKQHKNKTAQIHKTKPNAKENANQQSTLRHAHVSAYHCAQLLYTIEHRTALTIFPLIFQTIIIAQILFTGGEGNGLRLVHNKVNYYYYYIHLKAFFP